MYSPCKQSPWVSYSVGDYDPEMQPSPNSLPVTVLPVSLGGPALSPGEGFLRTIQPQSLLKDAS